MREGALAIELPDGSLVRLGDENAHPVRLRVHDWRFFRRVLASGDIGAGESFVAGEWETDDLPELVALYLRNTSSIDHRAVWMWPSRAIHAMQRLLSANTRFGSRRNVRRHYDLGNELFESFLDDSMTYSCGLFDGDATSLADAQRAKIDLACRTLGLSADMHLLEIGSGWGALALHAAATCGCRVTSITLSREQLAVARERARAAGLERLVDFRLCDYRDVGGSFDRIVSIEMLEAVGAGYYDCFFRRCDDLLQAGGRMFLQTITVPDDRFDSYRTEFDWIRKYIYPGGCLPSRAVIAGALGAHTNLRIESLREIGPHYAATLRRWRERFHAARPRLRTLGYDERFLRMWELYLGGCEAAFATTHLGNVQMVIAKEPGRTPLRSQPVSTAATARP